MQLISLKGILETAAATISAKPFFQIGRESNINIYLADGQDGEAKLPLLWTLPITTTGTKPNGQNKSIDTQNVTGMLFMLSENDLSLDDEFDNHGLADQILRDFVGVIQTTEIERGNIKINNFEISPVFNLTSQGLWGVGWIMNITSPDDFKFCCDK